jgi:hypothetical protein
MNAAPTHDAQRPPKAKLIQICASQNDLFALDSDGTVYQYDFNAKMWERLDARRSRTGRPQEER